MGQVKVLFVTSEVAGLAKAGGLGEVSAGLPLALHHRGIDVRLLMPAYSEVVARLPSIDWFGDLPARAGIPSARVGEARLSDGVRLYLVSSPALFERRGTPYCTPEGADWQDNHLRFARLSLAASDIAAGRGGLGWVPDIYALFPKVALVSVSDSQRAPMPGLGWAATVLHGMRPIA